MIGTNITTQIIEDTATPALRDLYAKCDPHVVATRVAVATAKHWRDHLKSLPRNKNCYPSTGFWESAARSVVGVAKGGDALITADKLGLRQRLMGGTITARNVQNITIPICAEAYGTTVATWGFDNLVLVILADGRKFLALWLGSEQAQAAYDKNLTKLTKHAGTTAAKVGRFRASVGEQKKPSVIVFRGKGTGTGGAQVARAQQYSNLKFLFVLKRSVEQAANPNVLPPDSQEFAIEQVRQAVQP